MARSGSRVVRITAIILLASVAIVIVGFHLTGTTCCCRRALHVSNLDPAAATKWTLLALDDGIDDGIFSALEDMKGDTVGFPYGYTSHELLGLEWKCNNGWPKRLTLVSRKEGGYRIMEALIGEDTHEIDMTRIAVKAR